MTPAWWRARLDPGLLAAGLIGLAAAWPFLTRASLPVFTDTEQHVYRTFEILSAWRAGVPYVRWAPDLFHGFGYPVFNYYAPLTYYLAAAYGMFFGDGGAAAGIKFVYVFAAVAGAVGVYAWRRSAGEGLGALAASAAFGLSPFLAGVEPHSLGHAPQYLGIALMPWTFWAFQRLRAKPSPGRMATAALALAAGLLAHNIVALFLLALLAAWLAWSLMQASNRGAGLAAVGALALGVGLTAFFWWPAIAERGAVRLANVAAGPSLDYASNFVPLGELLGASRRADALDPHSLTFRLGVAQWVLAALGVAGLGRMAGAARREVVFWALAAAGMLFFVLPQSRPVWDAVPGLALLQFPWRLLGALALALAVLAGAGCQALMAWAGHGRDGTVMALVMAALVGSALPLLNPLPWPDFEAVNAARVLRAELEWEVGTTASNEFLPAGVLAVPGAQASLLESYAEGAVDKVNRATLPAGTRVELTAHGPRHDLLAVSGAEPFVLRLYTFDFPGWRAYVDGARVNIEPSEPEAWITLPVPAGAHTVLVRFEDTPARQAGWVVSALAAVLCLGLTAWTFGRLRLRSAATTARNIRRGSQFAAPLAWRQAIGLAGIVVLGLCVNAAIPQSVWWQPVLSRSASSTRSLPIAALEHKLALSDARLEPRSAQPGETITLALQWAATGRVTQNARVFVHLIGPDGRVWAQSDKFHPGEFTDLPTGRWPPGYALVDTHSLLLPLDAPPGVYEVRVGLWNGYSGARLQVLDGAGQASGDSVVLEARVEVGR